MATLQFPEHATSHQQVTAWRTKVYYDGLAAGQHERFVLPMFFYGTGIVFLYMLIPALKGRLVRYGVFGINSSFQLWVMANCRSANASGGLMIGMLSAWSLLWSAVLLVFNDGKKKFKRIVRTPQGDKVIANGSPSNGHLSNGHAKHTTKMNGSAAKAYEWQSYPSTNFSKRIGWVTDLVFNFRGIGWDWKVSGMPSRAPEVEAALREIDLVQAIKEDHPVTSAGRYRMETRSQVVTHYGLMFLKGYILLDLLKTIINRDPYFWGLVDAAPPAYLPEFVASSKGLVSAYRSVVSVAFFWLSLETVFTLVPLGLVGLLGPQLAGCNGEAWMYPDQYGNYKTVFQRGLAGFWGGWWHQVFRVGFQSGGRWLTADVLRLKPKSPLAAVIELSTSFNLSGFLHVAASITMIGDTQPWTKMLLFFVLQPVGILAELIVAHLVNTSGLGRRMPRWLGWLGHFTYTHAWLYLTVPYLADDLVRGGMLLFEPVAFSPLRGLGLGAPGDGWACWQDLNTSWYWDAKRWWMSGLSI